MNHPTKTLLSVIMLITTISACSFTTPPVNDLQQNKNRNSGELSENSTTAVNPTDESNQDSSLGIETANAQITETTTLAVTQGKEVYLKHGESAQYQAIETSSELVQGDYVRVGESSRAEITWVDDSVTRLAPNTELKVTTLSFDEDDPTNTNILFEVISGDTWNRAINIVNEKAGFSMQNGNVIAGIRGTTVGFTVENGNVLIRALEHTVYLNDDEKTALSEGDEASVDNARTKSERPRVKIRKIAAEFYRGSWFAQNSLADEKINDRIKTRMFAALQKEFGPGAVSGAGSADGIALPQDPKSRASALLKDANAVLNEAIYELSQKNQQGAQILLKDYQEKLSELKKIIATVPDTAVRTDLENQLSTQGRLWAKYALILFPDQGSISEELQTNVLDQIQDKTKKEMLEKLYDTRRFYNLTDALNNATDSEKAGIVEKLNQSTIQIEDCRLLENIKDKLPNGELPEKCRENENRNATILSEPDSGLFTTLLGRAKNLGCENVNIAPQIQDIVSQQTRLTPAQSEQLQNQIKTLKTSCITSLKAKITEAQKALQTAKNQLNALPLSIRNGPAGEQIRQSLQTINATITKLNGILSALGGV